MLRLNGRTNRGIREIWLNPDNVIAIEEWSNPPSQQKYQNPNGLTRIIIVGGNEMWADGRVAQKILDAQTSKRNMEKCQSRKIGGE